jgi:hypothetical protein
MIEANTEKAGFYPRLILLTAIFTSEREMGMGSDRIVSPVLPLRSSGFLKMHVGLAHQAFKSRNLLISTE